MQTVFSERRYCVRELAVQPISAMQLWTEISRYWGSAKYGSLSYKNVGYYKSVLTTKLL